MSKTVHAIRHAAGSVAAMGREILWARIGHVPCRWPWTHPPTGSTLLDAELAVDLGSGWRVELFWAEFDSSEELRVEGDDDGGHAHEDRSHRG